MKKGCVNLAIDRNIRNELKKYAVDNEVTLQDLVAKILTVYIEEVVNVNKNETV